MSESISPDLLLAALSEEQAEQLEVSLERDPSQIGKRAQLMVFYLSCFTPEANAARVRHLLWLISNSPSHSILSTPIVGISNKPHFETYNQLQRAWLEQVERHLDSVPVLLNAATFFQVDDPGLAESLFLRARELAPDDPLLNIRLGHFKARVARLSPDQAKNSSHEQFQYYSAALSAAADSETKLCALTSLVNVLVEAESFQQAQDFSLQLMSLAEKNIDSWAYGNAIYSANMALATAALRLHSDVDGACSRLILASQTSGSPQLNSFGADYKLARQLLVLGRTADVRTYILNCAKFWRSDRGCSKFWLQQISEGVVPIFDKYDFMTLTEDAHPESD